MKKNLTEEIRSVCLLSSSVSTRSPFDKCYYGWDLQALENEY
jgi:hypothetical protein